MSMDYNECGIVDVTGRYDTAVGVSKDHAIFEDKGRHREIGSAATPRRTLYSFLARDIYFRFYRHFERRDYSRKG
jgi:hypothetical protein